VVEFCFRKPQSLQLQGHWHWKRHAKWSTARTFLPLYLSHLRHARCWGPPTQPKFPLGLGLREPHILQLQGYWGWRRHPKRSMALHQPCFLHNFLTWATNGGRDLHLSLNILLGLGLRMRAPQSLQLQGNWRWKRHAKGSMQLHQHCSFHAFLTWSTHAAGHLSISPKMPLGLGLGLRKLQILQLQAYWGRTRHAKSSTALHQRCFLHSFLIWATHGGRDLSFSPRSRLGSGLRFEEPQSLQRQGQWGLKSHDKESTAMHQHCFLYSFFTWPHKVLQTSDSAQAPIMVRVRISRATKPTAPGTLVLEKACQGEQGTAPTLLPPHLSHLGYMRW